MSTRTFIEGQHWHWHTGQKVLLHPRGVELRDALGLPKAAGVNEIVALFGGWDGVASANAAAVKAAEAEGYERGYAEGYKAGVLKERGRVAAILALDEAKHRPQHAIKLALLPGVSPQTAQAALGAMPAAMPSQKRLWGCRLRAGESKLGLVLAGEGDE